MSHWLVIVKQEKQNVAPSPPVSPVPPVSPDLVNAFWNLSVRILTTVKWVYNVSDNYKKIH